MSKKFQIISLIIVAVIAFVVWVVVNANSGGTQTTEEQNTTQSN